MEPIPETERALTELEASTEVRGLRESLVERAQRARSLVPDLVGVSIARLEEGLTFTLVASEDEMAVLDAVQYLAGGPCVDGARTGEQRRIRHVDEEDALDEEGWRLFAVASASRSVRSTLTLPLTDEDGRVLGSVNLYAGSARAFDGVEPQLALLFGAWAAGAVRNADLSFSTRLEAQQAPERMRHLKVIDHATGIIAAEQGIDVEMAAQRLRSAAAQADVPLELLAQQVIDAYDNE